MKRMEVSRTWGWGGQGTPPARWEGGRGGPPGPAGKALGLRAPEGPKPPITLQLGHQNPHPTIWAGSGLMKWFRWNDRAACVGQRGQGRQRAWEEEAHRPSLQKGDVPHCDPLHSSPSRPGQLRILPKWLPSSLFLPWNLKKGRWDFQAAKLNRAISSSCHRSRKKVTGPFPSLTRAPGPRQ